MAERRKSVSRKKPKRVAAVKSKRLSAMTAKEPLDGCDLRISDAEATPDEDLPASHGGVD